MVFQFWLRVWLGCLMFNGKISLNDNLRENYLLIQAAAIFFSFDFEFQTFLKILAGVLFILGHGQNKKKRFTAEKRIRI